MEEPGSTETVQIESERSSFEASGFPLFLFEGAAAAAAEVMSVN